MNNHIKLITSDFNLEPLDQSSTYAPLREIVYQKLKTAILESSLKPGQLISENQIADKLSVSRTPVREALRILDTENLVALLPGRKLVVTVPTLQDINEVYDIRLIVESEALRRITPNNQTLIHQMEEALQLGEEYRKKGDLQKRGEMNTQFHLLILSALENQRVERFMDSLHETISRFRVYYLTKEWPVEPEEEHNKILTLIKQGHTEEAVSVLQLHLITSKENLIKVFTQK
jgi:DNA-binding GntR family transcriptional regulator